MNVDKGCRGRKMEGWMDVEEGGMYGKCLKGGTDGRID